jgi:hypothetical protein
MFLLGWILNVHLRFRQSCRLKAQRRNLFFFLNFWLFLNLSRLLDLLLNLNFLDFKFLRLLDLLGLFPFILTDLNKVTKIESRVSQDNCFKAGGVLIEIKGELIHAINKLLPDLLC